MVSDIKSVFQDLFWLLSISGQNCIKIYENNPTFGSFGKFKILTSKLLMKYI